jgi:3-oxoadipate enol-lactonase
MPFVQVNDVLLHYTREGSGGSPLLLHELGGSTQSWEHVGNGCAQQHDMICPDLRGAGRSEKKGPYDFPTLIADLEGFVSMLGLIRVHVAGCAMSSMLLLACAASGRSPFASITFCSVGPGLTDQGRAYLRDRADRVVKTGMASVSEESTRNSFPKGFAAPYMPTLASYKAAFLANDPFAYAGQSKSLCDFDVDAADFFLLSCPTQVISGAADHLWPPKEGRRVAQRLGTKQVHVIEEAAHFPPLQNPAAFASRLLAFPASVDRDGGGAFVGNGGRANAV